MLKAKLSDFYEMVEHARSICGESAPLVTDAIIATAFPETVEAADREGCDKMLRNGVLEAVKKRLRTPKASDLQRSIFEIHPEILPYVEPLQSGAYYVPGCAEYCDIAELCEDLVKLDAARKFTRQKGEETLAEAKRLDDLFAFLLARQDAGAA